VTIFTGINHLKGFAATTIRGTYSVGITFIGLRGLMRERVFSIVIEISALEKQLSMLENETIPNVTELSRRVKEDGVTIKRLRDNNQILIVELEEKRNTLFEMQENNKKLMLEIASLRQRIEEMQAQFSLPDSLEVEILRQVEETQALMAKSHQQLQEEKTKFQNLLRTRQLEQLGEEKELIGGTKLSTLTSDVIKTSYSNANTRNPNSDYFRSPISTSIHHSQTSALSNNLAANSTTPSIPNSSVNFRSTVDVRNGDVDSSCNHFLLLKAVSSDLRCSQ